MNIDRPRFLKNMHCEGQLSYGKETVKAVAVLMDIEPSGTSREEILQEVITNSQEHQKSPCKDCQDTMIHGQ